MLESTQINWKPLRILLLAQITWCLSFGPKNEHLFVAQRGPPRWCPTGSWAPRRGRRSCHPWPRWRPRWWTLRATPSSATGTTSAGPAGRGVAVGDVGWDGLMLVSNRGVKRHVYFGRDLDLWYIFLVESRFFVKRLNKNLWDVSFCSFSKAVHVVGWCVPQSQLRSGSIYKWSGYLKKRWFLHVFWHRLSMVKRPGTDGLGDSDSRDVKEMNGFSVEKTSWQRLDCSFYWINSAITHCHIRLKSCRHTTVYL